MTKVYGGGCKTAFIVWFSYFYDLRTELQRFMQNGVYRPVLVFLNLKCGVAEVYEVGSKTAFIVCPQR